MSTLRLHAQCFAERGWPVLRLHGLADGAYSCQHASCACPGKHPLTQHAAHDASRDADEIKACWRQWPRANTRIAIGPTSGLFALDIDPRNGGDQSLTHYVGEFGPLRPPLAACTGGRGQHLVFLRPKETAKKDTLGRGHDIAATPGSIVAPPSCHASKRRYVWPKGQGLKSRRPAALPKAQRQWLVSDTPPPSVTAPHAFIAPARAMPEVGRRTLLRAANAATWVQRLPTYEALRSCPDRLAEGSGAMIATLIWMPAATLLGHHPRYTARRVGPSATAAEHCRPRAARTQLWDPFEGRFAAPNRTQIGSPPTALGVAVRYRLSDGVAYEVTHRVAGTTEARHA